MKHLNGSRIDEFWFSLSANRPESPTGIQFRRVGRPNRRMERSSQETNKSHHGSTKLHYLSEAARVGKAQTPVRESLLSRFHNQTFFEQD